jgi:hypothetical protein
MASLMSSTESDGNWRQILAAVDRATRCMDGKDESWFISNYTCSLKQLKTNSSTPTHVMLLHVPSYRAFSQLLRWGKVYDKLTCTPVEKKSRYDKTASRPPARSTAAGCSKEIFSKA